MARAQTKPCRPSCCRALSQSHGGDCKSLIEVATAVLAKARNCTVLHLPPYSSPAMQQLPLQCYQARRRGCVMLPSLASASVNSVKLQRAWSGGRECVVCTYLHCKRPQLQRESESSIKTCVTTELWSHWATDSTLHDVFYKLDTRYTGKLAPVVACKVSAQQCPPPPGNSDRIHRTDIYIYRPMPHLALMLVLREMKTQVSESEHTFIWTPVYVCKNGKRCCHQCHGGFVGKVKEVESQAGVSKFLLRAVTHTINVVQMDGFFWKWDAAGYCVNERTTNYQITEVPHASRPWATQPSSISYPTGWFFTTHAN